MKRFAHAHRTAAAIALMLACIALLGGCAKNIPPAATSSAPETQPAAPAAPLPAGTVAVPKAVGSTQAEAESAISAAGFVPLATYVVTSTAAPGTVVAQFPAAESGLAAGSQVSIATAQQSPASQLPLVAMPTVYQMKRVDAQSLLMSLGLAPIFISLPSQEAAGDSFAQLPAASEMVTPGSVALIALSNGVTPQTASVAIPDVVGKSEADAKQALSGAKLGSQSVTAFNAAAKGTVFRQLPAAGGQVAPNTPVALGISLGPLPSGAVAVPSVVGKDAASALKTLSAAGLIAQQAQISDTTSAVGTVVGQLPSAGWSVPAGTIVIVSVESPKSAK